MPRNALMICLSLNVLSHFADISGCSYRVLVMVAVLSLYSNDNKMLNRDAENRATCEPVDPHLTNTSSP